MTDLPTRSEVRTADDMWALAALVADRLHAGDLVILRGPLGAGKTTFAQGLGVALGVDERLTSPTFVIARLHHGRVPVIHVDAYRLGSIDELDDLDLDAQIGDAVTIVEWGSGIAEQLASDGYLLVDIDREAGDDDETRMVRISGTGRRWSGVTTEDEDS